MMQNNLEILIGQKNKSIKTLQMQLSLRRYYETKKNNFEKNHFTCNKNY